MTITMMGAAIRAPAPAPPPHNLLDLSIDLRSAEADATGVETAGIDRWENGFTFIPEPADVGSMWGPCFSDHPVPNGNGGREGMEIMPDPLGGSGGIGSDVKPTGADVEAVYYVPLMYLATYSCQGAGERVDYFGRARRKLEAVKHRYVEAEFWRGDWAQALPLSNPYLANAATATQINGGAAMAFLDGLGALQDYMGAHGGLGYIHTTRTAANYMVGLGVVHRSEDTNDPALYDAFGNVVIAGSGYDGTGPGNAVPGAGNTWIYGTGPTYSLESEPWMTPEDMATGLNRVTNEMTVQAEMLAAVVWDVSVHAAVQLTLP